MTSVCNDIRSYSELSLEGKKQVQEELVDVLQCMQVGYVETSIVPPVLLINLWFNYVHYEDQKLYHLMTSSLDDRGTIFHIENKS